MTAQEYLRTLIAGYDPQDDSLDRLAATLRGPQPFLPGRDTPQDVGLGGPSTEYLFGTEDEQGTPTNLPQIWWLGGRPQVLSPDQAYGLAMQYEQGTGRKFPRFVNDGAADFAAENRSALGGAEARALAGLYGYGNF